MNTINNKRRKDSVEKIEYVFLKLIQTKNINQISVTYICKAAILNRTTFYSNYIDIYDLVEKIRLKMIEEFLDVYEEEHLEKKNSDVFSKLFNHIKDNQLFYKTYFKLEFDLLSDDFLLDKNDIVKWYETHELSDYHVTFFKAWLNAIIKKWLDGGCKESPKEINNVIESEYKKRIDI